MAVILVVDEHDTPGHTHYVNGLADPRRHRAVAHVPTTQTDLGAELLRALSKTRHLADPAPVATPTRDHELALNWIQAAHRLDLILYGAWRLSPRQLTWLTTAASGPRTRLWLITHRGARNLQALVRASAAVWSFKQFRDAQRRSRTPRPGRTRQGRRRDTTPKAALQPWPWFLPAATVRSRDADPAGVLRAPVLRHLPVHVTPTRIAKAVVQDLNRYEDDHRRTMRLLVAQEDLFRRGIWLSIDEREVLDACAQLQARSHTGPAEHELLTLKAPSEALSYLIAALGLAGEPAACLIGADGSCLIDADGLRYNVPSQFREIARAARPAETTDPWVPPSRGPVEALHRTAIAASVEAIERVARAIHLDSLARERARGTPIRGYRHREASLEGQTAADSDVAIVGACLADTGLARQVDDIAAELGWEPARLDQALSDLAAAVPAIGMQVRRSEDQGRVRLVARHTATRRRRSTTEVRCRPLEVHEAQMLYWIAQRQMVVGRRHQSHTRVIEDFAETAAERHTILELALLRLVQVGNNGQLALTSWLERYLRDGAISDLDWHTGLD